MTSDPARPAAKAPAPESVPGASVPETGRALQARNAVLEQRVDELGGALAACNRQLEQFAHGVSHDLRAPLRAIDGFAGLLESQLGDDMTQDGNQTVAYDYLARIRNAAAHAGELIDALLELSRVGRNPLQRQPVDLSLLADWVLVELQDAEQGRAAQIEVQPGLEVVGDERLLKQLLQQVLHNAWKFSGEREQVRIEVRGERVGDVLHLQIHDAGCGFDMRYADKLFEPFQRLHGPEAAGGNGIGLAIAQRIVERHGGRIRAQSEPGVGSTFHIQLPVAPLAVDSEQAGAKAAKAAEPIPPPQDNA